MPSADETHHDVIQRILFIYAKLNPGVRYVQGMNEILAPIYFTFAKDTDIEFRRGAETDAFFCFANLMTEIRDRFIRSLDCTSAGIIAAVKDLNDLLAKVDRKLHAHLRKLNIDPRFYAFRWLTLLLSQEFELPDTIRLWDSLFADSHRFQHLTYCCCAMLLLYRDDLLAGDFPKCLQLLQDYPASDLQDIMGLATHLRDRTKFEVSVANGQQLVMPIDLDKHLGIEVRRRSRN
uniref:Rab-GAP TBC domain-containing protein n=1 Tax=Amorphochlora amoebiformis TaxID=1561963 RepID=A0A7S0DIS3_9EUKA|mmetsp:Transcript_29700/g.47436  ORF Transcript_29700/g.47436 Transcript_29700/m.47436 type:complete len:234 (+) Transcript_29700:405-1106(+)